MKKKSSTVFKRHHFLLVFYFLGGQKQRIAIARALLKVNTAHLFWKLIRSQTDQGWLGYRLLALMFPFGEILFSSVVSPQNPRILLLDEATRWLRNSFRIQWTDRFTTRLVRFVWTLWWDCLLSSILSALDAENELLVQEALERLMEGKNTYDGFCLFCSEKTVLLPRLPFLSFLRKNSCGYRSPPVHHPEC